MTNFHPLEVVCRGSETQLQVGENLSYLTIPDTHRCKYTINTDLKSDKYD